MTLFNSQVTFETDIFHDCHNIFKSGSTQQAQVALSGKRLQDAPQALSLVLYLLRCISLT